MMKNVVMTGVALGLLAGAWTGAGAADGKTIYDSNCAGCHKVMKPKLGDKAQWAPLIKEGEDALDAAAIKGKGTMPPKGGKKALSDDDVKAAVHYMVEQGK
jgi:cytochrome c5